MKLIEGSPRAVRRLVPAVAVFAVVVLGVPVYEATHGNAPSVGAGAPSRDAVLTGRYFRSVETTLAERSATAAAVRPHYNEVLFAAFGKTTPKVVAGVDGWLFLAETSLDYPPRDGDALVARHAALIGELAAWWRLRGTLLLSVPV
ncbi:MAG TPA: hypothetical protein VEI02_12940, partial [Planctomycetota bacterium]|nr:hypothetical protein [Planctomycetota bacterium]